MKRRERDALPRGGGTKVKRDLITKISTFQGREGGLRSPISGGQLTTRRGRSDSTAGSLLESWGSTFGIAGKVKGKMRLRVGKKSLQAREEPNMLKGVKGP